MKLYDLVNGGFEGIGALVAWSNVWRLHKDQMVRGVTGEVFWFYAAWGCFNIIFYHETNTPISWWAGLMLTIANITWVGMYWRLRFKDSSS